jgi:Fe-Mn family superoxide dismutase
MAKTTRILLLLLCAYIQLFAFADVSKTTDSYQVRDFSYLKGMPGFSDKLLDIHFTLYAGYVKNCNLLQGTLQGLADEDKASSYEYSALKRRFSWEFDGMRLHEYYFENLGGDGKIDLNSGIYKALSGRFGTYEKWKKEFTSLGMSRGIGWVVLYIEEGSGLLHNIWVNEHNVGNLVGSKIVFAMDVWEHAYMVEYELDRSKYIGAVFQNIDWKVVEKRYEKYAQK